MRMGNGLVRQVDRVQVRLLLCIVFFIQIHLDWVQTLVVQMVVQQLLIEVDNVIYI